MKAWGDLTLLSSILDLELEVGSHASRLTEPAIYKVGYKSGNPQCIKMTMYQKSSPVHHPAIHNCARSVISISDGNSNIAESMMEPDTELECYSPENQLSLPENQLGLPENRAWLDHPDVSNVSEASGKHWFDCRQMQAEDST